VTIYILAINFLNSISKSNKIVLYSTSVLLVLFMGGIYNCADDQNYKDFFGYVKQHGLHFFASIEIGFIFLVFVAGKIGLTYTLFRTFIGFIGLILIQKTVLDFTKKYSFVYLLYFIYPFMLDVIQYQNFLATSIVIYSMRFLVQSSKKGDIKFLIGILVAFSIHYMAVFFLPFVLIKKISVKELFLSAVILVPVLCLLTSSPLIPNLVNKVVGKDLAAILEVYFKRAHWGFLLLWARQISISFVTYFCFLLVQESDFDDKWKIFNNLVIKLNIYLVIICFPLMMFDGNFFRLLRPLLILNYIVISQTVFLRQKKGLYLALVALIIIVSYLLMDVLGTNFHSILIPFFQNNKYL
jgi:hypothetical protein